MFKPEIDTRIYLYSWSQQKFVRTFADLDEVMQFIAREMNNLFPSVRSWKFKGRNFDTTYLGDLNCTGNDQYSETYTTQSWNEELQMYSYDWHTKVFTKEWTFVDAQNRSIDVRMYEEQIRKYHEEFKNAPRKPYVPMKFYLNHNNKNLVDFRADPVPGTGKHYYGHCTRTCPRIMQEARYNTDPDYEQFVRGHRKPRNLYGFYHGWRHESKSWKDCTKKRHQWE